MKRWVLKHPLLVTLVGFLLAAPLFLGSAHLWITRDDYRTLNRLDIDIEYLSHKRSDSLDLFINGGEPYRIPVQFGRSKISLPVPGTKLSKLRIDPSNIKGRVFRVHSIALRKVVSAHDDRTSVLELNTQENISFANIEVLKNGKLRAETDDPIVLVGVRYHLVPSGRGSATLLMRDGALIVISLLLGGLFVFMLRLWRSCAESFAESSAPCRISLRWQDYAAVSIICLFAFFVLQFVRPYIADSRIIVEGATTAGRALRLAWDRGAGFDEFEQTDLAIDGTAASAHLPRHVITRVKFLRDIPEGAKVVIYDANGQRHELAAATSRRVFEIKVDRTAFHPVHVFVQVLAVATIALFALGVLCLWRARHGWAAFLATRRRYAGLLIGAYSVPFFTFWLLGQWPGGVTHDSLYIWNCAKTLDISNDHPWINTIAYAVAQQFYDSPAIISSLQVLICSALFGYIGHGLYSLGLPLLVLAPFLFLGAVAVPIGIYNTMLWKDIPFAFATLFWSFYFFKSSCRARLNGPRALPLTVILLLLLTMLGFLFRHGGEYLIVLALAIVFFSGAFSFATAFRLLVGSIVLLAVSRYVVDPLVTNKQSSLAFYHAYSLLNPMGALVSNNYHSPEPDADKKVFEKFVTDISKLRAYLPVNVAPLHLQGVKEDIAPAAAEEIATAVIRAALLNPGIWFADRIAIFFSSMNEMRSNHYGMTAYNLLRYQMLPIVYQEPNLYYLVSHPPFPRLEEQQAAMIARSLRAADLFEGRHLHWNSLPHFMVLCAALLLARWLPGSALYSFFSLAFAGVVLLTIPTNNWRYLYFVYLAGFFMIPVMIAEAQLKYGVWAKAELARLRDRYARRSNSAIG